MKSIDFAKLLDVKDKISIAIQTNHNIKESLLYNEEIALISSRWSEKRKKTFIMGRLAGKKAMSAITTNTCPILRGEMGEPIWSKSFIGSIAHKDNIAISAISKNDIFTAIGIDIEDSEIILDNKDIELFCSKKEQLYLANNHHETIIFFSIKESVIKAYYIAYGKLIDMKDIDCCELIKNKPASNIKVKYTLINNNIISLCMIKN